MKKGKKKKSPFVKQGYKCVVGDPHCPCRTGQYCVMLPPPKEQEQVYESV